MGPMSRHSRTVMTLAILALFLLPFVGGKLGVDLDVFGYLVGAPVRWMLHYLMAVI